MDIKKTVKKYKILINIVFINILIFAIINLLFDIKYEQVDDFIIYNLYSGLDGTYNIHGIYIHPIICFIISLCFRVIPMINWHTIFLLLMQFTCFSIIGTIIVRKSNSKLSYLLYVLFASVCYTSLLQLIQYTSVSALLILTAFFVIIDYIENERIEKKYIICYVTLFTIGIMTRMQSLLIILPFFTVYFLYSLILFFRKKIEKVRLVKLIKNYIIIVVLVIIVYASNYIIYNTNEIYKEFMEYTDARVILHDISYTPYEENKEIFDEIGWSNNDHYLFYTFNFGDENVFSKENIEKIVEYKKNRGDLSNWEYEFTIGNFSEDILEQMRDTNPYISIMFFGAFLVAIYTNQEKRKYIIAIFLITIATNTIFIVLGRTMHRVVIPEFVLGIIIFLYYIKYKETNDEKIDIIKAISIFIIVVASVFSGGKYEFNYKLEDYNNYKSLIEYTNSYKENVYLYTVPALQYRYLAYSVYEMPPEGSFSNLRVMGGWDMYTENYYDFKERYNLEGTFLDLLKENVYLIDGDVFWSGIYYQNYIDNVVLFIKEHYDLDVTYEKLNTFGNLYIYKIKEVAE